MVDTQSRAHELQKQYNKEWRRKNKERVKQYNQRYWEKKARAELEGCVKDGKEEIQS